MLDPHGRQSIRPAVAPLAQAGVELPGGGRGGRHRRHRHHRDGHRHGHRELHVFASCDFTPSLRSLTAPSLDGLQSPVINVALILRFLAPGPNFGVKRSKSKRG